MRSSEEGNSSKCVYKASFGQFPLGRAGHHVFWVKFLVSGSFALQCRVWSGVISAQLYGRKFLAQTETFRAQKLG